MNDQHPNSDEGVGHAVGLQDFPKSVSSLLRCWGHTPPKNIAVSLFSFPTPELSLL